MFSDGVQEFIYEEGLTKASRKWSYRRVMYARMEYLKERLLSDQNRKLGAPLASSVFSVAFQVL